MLKARGTPLVLGLRDVMDEPGALAPEWERKNVVPALRDLYDDIWVYGLPQICDPLAGIELPRSRAHEDDLYRLSARAACRSRRSRRRRSEDRPSRFLLVTTGGGGDGEAVIDWVLRAYESDRALPLPALLVLGPFMQSERQAEFLARAAPAARRSRRSPSTPSIEQLMARAGRRRRDGRLQHLLRDPVVRQAGADRAAHRAAPGAVHPRRPGRRSSAWSRMLPDDGRQRCRGAWRPRCGSCRSRRLPSEVVVPGLLDGLDNVNRLADTWLARSRQPSLQLADPDRADCRYRVRSLRA